jgi:hypothetical protein
MTSAARLLALATAAASSVKTVESLSTSIPFLSHSIPNMDVISLEGSGQEKTPAPGAWPTASRVQQSAVPVVGFLNGGSADMSADRGRAFHNVANAENRYHPQLS